MNVTRLFGMYVVPQKTVRYFGLPNGGVTTDREEARRAWEIHALMKNVRSCNVTGKVKYTT